jgi:hypothetical protein
MHARWRVVFEFKLEMSAAFDLGATVYRTGLLPNPFCSKSLFYNNMLSNNGVKRRRILRLQSNFGKAPRGLPDRDSSGTSAWMRKMNGTVCFKKQLDNLNRKLEIGG